MLTDPFKLLAASNGLKGLVEYDLRTLAGNYFPVHDYQIMTACQGKGVLSNLVITSGSTKTFKYEISVYKTGSLNEFKKLVPGHKGVINCVDIGEDSIVSGAKDGSVRVLNFSKSKERLRKESKTISIFTG
jgi:WD40 repeat protein